MSSSNTSALQSAQWFSCKCHPDRWHLGTLLSKCPDCASSSHYANSPALLRVVDRVARNADRKEWLESFEALAAMTFDPADTLLPLVCNRLPSWVSELWSVPQFKGVTCTLLERVRLACCHPSTAIIGVLFRGRRPSADLEPWVSDPLFAAIAELHDPAAIDTTLVAGEDIEDLLRFSNIDPDDSSGLVYDLKRGILSLLGQATTLTDVE